MRGKASLPVHRALRVVLAAVASLALAPHAFAASVAVPPGTTTCALLGCTASWAKVDSNIGAGWVCGLCANQVTTCN